MIDKTEHSITYRGGDGQSVFPITFPFLETRHLTARRRDGGGDWRDLAPGVDYLVNHISDGNGELILTGESLPAGAELEIARHVPLTQEILFHNQGPNSPRAIEEAVDKLTMIAQQQRADALAAAAEVSGEAFLEVETFKRDILAALANQDQALADKADAAHGHGIADVNGLAAALADKADAGTVAEALAAKANAGAVAEALAAKADAASVADKAPLGHTHPVTEVGGLSVTLASIAETQGNLADALAGKAGVGHRHTVADINGLSQTPEAHAASHAAAGGDPLTPAAIGAVAAPPADGKSYLATAAGWVEYVPPSGGGESGGGGTANHAELSNRDAANQHPQAAITGLVQDLANLAAGATGADTAIGALQTALAGKANRSELPTTTDADIAAMRTTLAGKADRSELLTATDADIAAMQTAIATKANRSELPGPASSSAAGLMSAADKAKLDGLSAGGGGSGGGGAGTVTGKIELWPFRAGELPAGWYFTNGDTYAVASGVGQALSGLPALYKSDWGIVESGGFINLPDLFSDLGGYFMRPVDGVTRQPGSRQEDAIRNLAGSTGGVSYLDRAPVSGPFQRGGSTVTGPSSGSGQYSVVALDASLAVPTAEENRPVNIGMTPAIYLGV